MIRRDHQFHRSRNRGNHYHQIWTLFLGIIRITYFSPHLVPYCQFRFLLSIVKLMNHIIFLIRRANYVSCQSNQQYHHIGSFKARLLNSFDSRHRRQSACYRIILQAPLTLLTSIRRLRH